MHTITYRKFFSIVRFMNAKKIYKMLWFVSYNLVVWLICREHEGLNKIKLWVVKLILWSVKNEAKT